MTKTKHEIELELKGNCKPVKGLKKQNEIWSV